MDRLKLSYLIDEFLEEYVESSDGGFAYVSDIDMRALEAIIYRLIMMKWEPDSDNDYPVQFRLADMNKERFVHPVTIHHTPPDEELLDNLLAGNGTLVELLDAIDSSEQAVISGVLRRMNFKEGGDESSK